MEKGQANKESRCFALTCNELLDGAVSRNLLFHKFADELLELNAPTELIEMVKIHRPLYVKRKIADTPEWKNFCISHGWKQFEAV